MLTLENVTARFGISDRALRRRLDALGPLIAPHIHRGQNNALLFDDGALAILDRLMQVQRETGLGLTEAVEKIKSELAHRTTGAAEERPQSVHSSADPSVLTKLITTYESRIESLERDKAYLQAKLDEALAKLPALPPSKPINLTRWQALKIALLGG